MSKIAVTKVFAVFAVALMLTVPFAAVDLGALDEENPYKHFLFVEGADSFADDFKGTNEGLGNELSGETEKTYISGAGQLVLNVSGFLKQQSVDQNTVDDSSDSEKVFFKNFRNYQYYDRNYGIIFNSIYDFDWCDEDGNVECSVNVQDINGEKRARLIINADRSTVQSTHLAVIHYVGEDGSKADVTIRVTMTNITLEEDEIGTYFKTAGAEFIYAGSCATNEGLGNEVTAMAMSSNGTHYILLQGGLAVQTVTQKKIDAGKATDSEKAFFMYMSKEGLSGNFAMVVNSSYYFEWVLGDTTVKSTLNEKGTYQALVNFVDGMFGEKGIAATFTCFDKHGNEVRKYTVCDASSMSGEEPSFVRSYNALVNIDASVRSDSGSTTNFGLGNDIAVKATSVGVGITGRLSKQQAYASETTGDKVFKDLLTNYDYPYGFVINGKTDDFITAIAIAESEGAKVVKTTEGSMIVCLSPTAAVGSLDVTVTVTDIGEIKFKLDLSSLVHEDKKVLKADFVAAAYNLETAKTDTSYYTLADALNRMDCVKDVKDVGGKVTSSESGTTVTLTVAPDAGFCLKGWDSNVPITKVSETVYTYEKTESAKVQAIFTPSNLAEVTFDYNDGETEALVEYEYSGLKYKLPEGKGESFDGWYTAPAGGDKVTVDTVVPACDEVTLYAHYKGAYKVSVELDEEQKTSGNIAKADCETADEGDEVTIYVKAAVGYGLPVEIKVTTDSGESVDVTGYKFKMPADNVNVTVKFTKVAKAVSADASVAVTQDASVADGDADVPVVMEAIEALSLLYYDDTITIPVSGLSMYIKGDVSIPEYCTIYLRGEVDAEKKQGEITLVVDGKLDVEGSIYCCGSILNRGEITIGETGSIVLGSSGLEEQSRNDVTIVGDSYGTLVNIGKLTNGGFLFSPMYDVFGLTVEGKIAFAAGVTLLFNVGTIQNDGTFINDGLFVNVGIEGLDLVLKVQDVLSLMSFMGVSISILGPQITAILNEEPVESIDETVFTNNGTFSSGVKYEISDDVSVGSCFGVVLNMATIVNNGKFINSHVGVSLSETVKEAYELMALIDAVNSDESDVTEKIKAITADNEGSITATLAELSACALINFGTVDNREGALFENHSILYNADGKGVSKIINTVIDTARETVFRVLEKSESGTIAMMFPLVEYVIDGLQEYLAVAEEGHEGKITNNGTFINCRGSLEGKLDVHESYISFEGVELFGLILNHSEIVNGAATMHDAHFVNEGIILNIETLFFANFLNQAIDIVGSMIPEYGAGELWLIGTFIHALELPTTVEELGNTAITNYAVLDNGRSDVPTESGFIKTSGLIINIADFVNESGATFNNTNFVGDDNDYANSIFVNVDTLTNNGRINNGGNILGVDSVYGNAIINTVKSMSVSAYLCYDLVLSLFDTTGESKEVVQSQFVGTEAVSTSNSVTVIPSWTLHLNLRFIEASGEGTWTQENKKVYTDTISFDGNSKVDVRIDTAGAIEYSFDGEKWIKLCDLRIDDELYVENGKCYAASKVVFSKDGTSETTSIEIKKSTGQCVENIYVYIYADTTKTPVTSVQMKFVQPSSPAGEWTADLPKTLTVKYGETFTVPAYGGEFVDELGFRYSFAYWYDESRDVKYLPGDVVKASRGFTLQAVSYRPADTVLQFPVLGNFDLGVYSAKFVNNGTIDNTGDGQLFIDLGGTLTGPGTLKGNTNLSCDDFSVYVSKTIDGVKLRLNQLLGFMPNILENYAKYTGITESDIEKVSKMNGLLNALDLLKVALPSNCYTSDNIGFDVKQYFNSTEKGVVVKIKSADETVTKSLVWKEHPSIPTASKITVYAVCTGLDPEHPELGTIVWTEKFGEDKLNGLTYSIESDKSGVYCTFTVDLGDLAGVKKVWVEYQFEMDGATYVSYSDTIDYNAEAAARSRR